MGCLANLIAIAPQNARLQIVGDDHEHVLDFRLLGIDTANNRHGEAEEENDSNRSFHGLIVSSDVVHRFHAAGDTHSRDSAYIIAQANRLSS